MRGAMTRQPIAPLVRPSSMRWRTQSRPSQLLLVGLPVLLALPACGTQPGGLAEETVAAGTLPVSQQARVDVGVQDAAAVTEVVAAADVMALELIDLNPEMTTVTSPASLQVALSMAAEGAEGQTLTELEALIGAAGPARSEAVNALTAALQDLEGDPAVVQADELPDTPVVHRADRLVLDDSLVIKQDFIDALARHYGATSQATDLGNAEGKAVMDAWVNEHTGGLIPDSAIQPSQNLRLVLQDAIVLAARWQDPFPAVLTSPERYTLPSGEVVYLDLMDPGKERDTVYAEVKGWQAVRLPYTGGRLHADVILPPVGTAPTDITPELLADLQQALDQERSTLLTLRMPVVDTESKLDLLPYLAEHAPSSLGGGFGGITDEALFISEAAQQAVLAIDEEGTIAAAVTEIAFMFSGPAQPPIEPTIDRPYLVRIADNTTGWPLFLAHIADPRGK